MWSVFTIIRLSPFFWRPIYFGPDVISEDNLKENFDLWHCHLRHLALSMSYFFLKTVNDIRYKCCDICLFAKLNRLSFQISEHKSECCFDFAYYDI